MVILLGTILYTDKMVEFYKHREYFFLYFSMQNLLYMYQYKYSGHDVYDKAIDKYQTGII